MTMSLLGEIAERAATALLPKGTRDRLASQEAERTRPFTPRIIDGNYRGDPNQPVNPSINGAQAGDTEVVNGIFPSRNGNPNQP